MTLYGRLIGAVAAGIVSVLVALAPAQAAAPILVKSCTIAKPRPMSHMASGTNVTFVNLGKRTASSVTFAVGYRNAAHHYLRRATDVGSFAPGATITHKLTLYNDVTYSGEQTSMCVPVEVKWEGGKVWIAPSH